MLSVVVDDDESSLIDEVRPPPLVLALAPSFRGSPLSTLPLLIYFCSSIKILSIIHVFHMFLSSLRQLSVFELGHEATHTSLSFSFPESVKYLICLRIIDVFFS